ncbi:MAG: hypothetical protein ABI197_03590 [Granulicella sp.]
MPRQTARRDPVGDDRREVNASVALRGFHLKPSLINLAAIYAVGVLALEGGSASSDSFGR